MRFNLFKNPRTFPALWYVLVLLPVWVALEVPRPTRSVPGRSGADPERRIRLNETLARLPLSFEANFGQTDRSVKFVSRGHGYSLFFTSTEAVLSLAKTGTATIGHPHAAANSEGAAVKSPVLRMQVLGANAAAEVRGLDELPGTTNYFKGKDPAQWRTGIPSYARVRYSAVYPGIDLVYYGRNRQLEYDFVVRPGADPGAIRLGFEGSENLSIDQRGDLVLRAAGEEIRMLKPVVYQQAMGRRQEIDADFVLVSHRQVAFEIGPYDEGETLIIDPILSYSTYLGGGNSDMGRAIAVDTTGSVYVTGQTSSLDFPLASPAQPTFGGGFDDVFVAKLNTEGTALAYSTYLGGSNDDSGEGIAVDGLGNAYVAGTSCSTDFPIANALQGTNGGLCDAFVTKINGPGSALLYSTYIGGSNDDSAFDIAVDGNGKAYVTGSTVSRNFPTWSPLQLSHGGGNVDAFVAGVNEPGSLFVYYTYLGGSNDDIGYGIAVDSSKNAYVTGTTASTNFLTANPLQAGNRGSNDAFVTKLNADGSAAVYSTYLGGGTGLHFDGYGKDSGHDIAVDSLGNAYVTGETYSANFPTVNPLQPRNGDVITHFPDAFVSKLNTAGSGLVYSTYLGGSDRDAGAGIAVDSSGNAYLTGYTFSRDFPTADPIQPSKSLNADAFVAKLNNSGSALVYSTYLGGSGGTGNDLGEAIAVDGFGSAYVTGLAVSSNFPTLNPLQPALGGIADAFIVKIADGSVPRPALTSIVPRSGALGTSVNVTLAGANFMDGLTTVAVSGSGISVAPPTVVSSTTLTTTIVISPAAAPIPRTVTVTNPGGPSLDGVLFSIGQQLFSRDR